MQNISPICSGGTRPTGRRGRRMVVRGGLKQSWRADLEAEVWPIQSQQAINEGGRCRAGPTPTAKWDRANSSRLIQQSGKLKPCRSSLDWFEIPTQLWPGGSQRSALKLLRSWWLALCGRRVSKTNQTLPGPGSDPTASVASGEICTRVCGPNSLNPSQTPVSEVRWPMLKKSMIWVSGLLKSRGH